MVEHNNTTGHAAMFVTPFMVYCGLVSRRKGCMDLFLIVFLVVLYRVRVNGCGTCVIAMGGR